MYGWRARIGRISPSPETVGAEEWRRSMPVIESLETDTGLPVVTSNQAGLWQALRLVGIRSSLPGLGCLLRDF